MLTLSLDLQEFESETLAENSICLGYLLLCNRASQVAAYRQAALVVKNLPASAGDGRDAGDPQVGKIPWRRAWRPSPVFLLGESRGQRSLVVCGP